MIDILRKVFTPHDFKLDEAGAVRVAFAQLNVVDSDGDLTLPGAFPRKAVPMSAYGHMSWSGDLPIGKGVIGEEAGWAVFTGQFLMSTDQGKNGHATVKEMAELQEWSYGYNVLDYSFEQRDSQSVRILKSLDVFEISPVLRGAGVDTHTLAIKSGAPGSDAPLAMQLSWYSEGLPALLDRYKGHATARATEGRKLSRADQAALDDLIDALENGATKARDVRTSADPPKSVDAVTLDILVSTAQRLGVTV